MDIVDYLITHISELPWIVKGPGLGVMALLLLRSFTQIFTLRWIKAATNVVYALIIALGMARFGQDIADYLKSKQVPSVEQINQSEQN